MKWRTLFIPVLIILCIVTFLPFFMAFLMEKEVFYFTSGAIDSWILFWGSYIGAIIGSIAVYIVAKFQIKKQHEHQIKEIKSESELLYQRDIEGYLLKNNINKLDDMLNVGEELYNRLKEIEKHFPEMIKTSFLDAVDQIDINEEEKEDKYDFLYENITKNIRQCHLLLRRLRTLSSYFPEMNDDLNEIDTLLGELDREIGIVFNVEKGYEHFLRIDTEVVTFELRTLPQLIQKLLDFIINKQRRELWNSLQEVKKITGVRIELVKGDER